MTKHFFTGLLSLLFILFLAGCKPLDEKFLSEGSIEYDASVVDPNSPMADMAPSSMTIKFKNNMSCVEMNAGMGLFSTAFITNPETKTLIQLVRLMNKKFSLVQNEEQLKKENELFNLEIIPTKQTKLIAGYKCKKAVAHYKGGNSPDFDIYYTQDLNIKNPNFANPYSMIDGVLMEYQMKKFGVEMKFTAKSVLKGDIDDSTFNLPQDYKAITNKEMNDLILGLQ